MTSLQRWLFVLNLRAQNWWDKNWYTSVTTGLAPASGEICTCTTWVKRFWLNDLLVLNLKISIAKASNWSFIWKSKRLYLCYKFSKWWYYQLDLENPNSARNDRIAFHFCLYLKIVPTNYSHFTKMKLKSIYQKCFSFHLNCPFSSCNIQILEEN